MNKPTKWGLVGVIVIGLAGWGIWSQMPKENEELQLADKVKNTGGGRKALINKIDVLPYFDFDLDKVKEYAHLRNPKLEIFPLSAKTGEGMEAWTTWLKTQVMAWNSND